MASEKIDLSAEPDDDFSKKSQKFQWYWAPVYCAVWFALFYVAVIPSFYAYPETLLIRDEHHYPDRFIGERAQIQLLGLANIGIKITGSVENEVHARDYLLKEVEKIKAAARLDLYDIDIDVQLSSGKLELWGMACSYHNITNIIVRLSPKNTRSQTYLLVNSHFDSEVGSPAAADAGVMIVIMLETLRVISRSERELKNPIVFLLNGAEEANMLASHGFITQHVWAPYCKAVINLDSAGSGGREVLFQSGPNHPWLMKYYKQSALHPYASTTAEELFQNNFIPSDSDFRIFRDYGQVPGVDMAHTLNGYIYHTKYDTFSNLERGTYQTTGDNVLAYSWGLANADELRDTAAYAEGHTVFYDYLGWFLVSYTETTGIVINIVTSIGTLIAIGVSVFFMTKRTNVDSAKGVYLRFLLIFVVQFLTVAAAAGLTILIAVLMDAFGLPEAWYSHEWLIFGLYHCPIFFVFGLFQALFIRWTRENSMQLNDTIACFMHSHCILIALLTIIMTAIGIRSAFMLMIAVFFYGSSVIVNLILGPFLKKSYYIPIHLICQLLPFWFYTYQLFSLYKTFVPMQGRDGPTSKPELFLAIVSALVSIIYAGFILPVLHKCRKSKIFFSLFGVITIVFIIIAATDAGFPYKKDVAPQRFYVLHTNRIIHNEFGGIVKNESGYYIQPVDARPNTLDDTTLKDATPNWADQECESEVYCGLPLYSTRWMDWKESMQWIPAGLPHLEIPTKLTLTGKEYLSATKVRFSFSLWAADRIVIYIDPYPKTNVSDWSFDRTLLDEHDEPPHFIYHVYSMSTDLLEFWLDIERDSPAYEGPSMRLAVGAHYLHHTHLYTKEYNEFLETFPDWVYTTDWIASHESWLF